MKISISKDREKVEKVVTLKGTQESVNRVLSLLTMIHLNGNYGHSGLFGISWDGDGADKIDIDFDGLKDTIKLNRDGIGACSDYGGYIEYVGENNTFFVADGKDIKSKRVWPKDE